MIIRKFQGKTEEEALEAAKKELGPAAVVMNVKTIKPTGLFSFFKKPVYEMTAAVEEESERQAAAAAAPQKEPLIPHELQRATEVKIAPLEEEEPATMLDSAIEEKLESLHSLLEKQLIKEAEPEEKEEEKNHVEGPETENSLFLKLIYKTLVENEVDEQYADRLMNEIDKINKPTVTIDFLLSNIYQKMILMFGQAKPITPAENATKLVFFIGPTGVGKTTTIAKIASRFRVNDKKRVALLTMDTYRIAAAEQLRTYASILDVSFRVIYSIEEMEKAVADFSEYDYVLIDTAGHAPSNASQQENLKQFIDSVGERENVQTEVFLVLSATTKYKDLKTIVDAYRDLVSFKLIFTKLDETVMVGNLLNLKLYAETDLSYITCGQNVPDDIELFNPQKTVKQLLGGR